jgi:hypothetical protein
MWGKTIIYHNNIFIMGFQRSGISVTQKICYQNVHLVQGNIVVCGIIYYDR